MPNAPMLNQFQYTYEKDSVTIYGSVTFDSGVVDSFQGGGIANIEQQTAVETASFTGQVAGMTEDVTIVADTPGAAGNSIALEFDGMDDIATVIAAWNVANPSNTATLTDGDDSQVPDNGEEIDLSGGVDASVGLFEVTLSDSFNTDLSMRAQIVRSTPSAICHIQIQETAANLQTAVRNKTSFTLETLNYAGSPADPEDDSMMMLRLVCRNTSMGPN